MKKNICVLGMLLALCSSLFAEAKKTELITYPAPREMKAHSQYSVTVNGKPVDIYSALSPKYDKSNGCEYYFCYFDFEGEVEVVVKSRNGWGKHTMYVVDKEEKKRLQSTLISEVYPPSLNAERTLEHVKIKQDKPFKAIVMRDGIVMPLIIFGNPIDRNAPKPDDPNVVYFGPGVHFIEKPISLKDNQTLYLAGGSVIKSDLKEGILVCAKNAKNVAFKGRGIVTFENRGRFTNRGLLVENCENVTIEGIILKDCNSWTLDMRNCKNVLVDNFKICGSRMINDDAIDVCNCVDVTIKDTFCRAQDDIIAIKGMPSKINLPVENIYIENCIFWTDSANVFRIGYECDAPYFKNIKCKNIYVPFYATYVKPTEYWSHAIVWLQPTSDMKISNFEMDGLHIRSNGKDMPLLIAMPRKVYHAPNPGSVENCLIKNVFVEGTKGGFRGEVWIEGKDEKYYAKNIKVSNAVYFGEKQKVNTKNIHVGPFAEDISVFEE